MITNWSPRNTGVHSGRGRRATGSPPPSASVGGGASRIVTSSRRGRDSAGRSTDRIPRAGSPGRWITPHACQGSRILANPVAGCPGVESTASSSGIGPPARYWSCSSSRSTLPSRSKSPNRRSSSSSSAWSAALKPSAWARTTSPSRCNRITAGVGEDDSVHRVALPAPPWTESMDVPIVGGERKLDPGPLELSEEHIGQVVAERGAAVVDDDGTLDRDAAATPTQAARRPDGRRLPGRAGTRRRAERVGRS